MVSDIEEFNISVKKNIANLGKSEKLQQLGVDFVRESGACNYSYNFSWMGVPVIQYPQDIVAMQEIIWSLKPDTIIETGVARGGSLIFYASMMKMMDIPSPKVIGIDIDIRPWNREVIESHPMAKYIELIQGSSIDSKTVDNVKVAAKDAKKAIVCLDSMHTEAHVFEELRMYADLVSPGSYLVVFDTSIEDMPVDYFPNRPWSVGNSPKTAIDKFLQKNDDFEIDHAISDKLLITVARNGFLKKKQK